MHLLLVLSWIHLPGQNISRGLQFIGDNDTEVATAIAIARDKSSVIGGSTTTAAGTKDAFIAWQDRNQASALRLGKTYSLGNGDLEIAAIDTAQPNGSIAIVANRTGGNGNPDALFLHLSSTGGILGSRFWAGSTEETLNDVLVLPDGSFIVVGRIRGSDVTSRSFVARVGNSSQNYSLVWARTLGELAGFPSAADEAVAVKQLPDGSLLVCGFTDQGASTSQGATFLWQLDGAGNTLALKRLTMSPLLRPAPADMTILPNGAIAICGNSNFNSFGPIRKGWICRLDPNLTNPVLRTVAYTGGTADQHLELRSIDSHPGSSQFWVAGNITVPTETGTDNEGLLMGFNEFLTPTFSSAVGFPGEERLNAIKLVASGSLVTARAVGFSDRTHARFLNMSNGDSFLVFAGDDGSACSGLEFFSIQLKVATVTLANISMTTNNSMTTVQVLPISGTYAPSTISGCNPLRLAGSSDQSDEEQESEEGNSEF